MISFIFPRRKKIVHKLFISIGENERARSFPQINFRYLQGIICEHTKSFSPPPLFSLLIILLKNMIFYHRLCFLSIIHIQYGRSESGSSSSRQHGKVMIQSSAKGGKLLFAFITDWIRSTSQIESDGGGKSSCRNRRHGNELQIATNFLSLSFARSRSYLHVK
jgi:hypothetical protein